MQKKITLLWFNKLLIIAYRCFQSLRTKMICQPHGIGWVKFDDLSSFVQMWRTLFTLFSYDHISYKNTVYDHLLAY